VHQRILLTGINGQVGHALNQRLAKAAMFSLGLIALDRSRLDLTNHDQLRQAIKHFKPDVIINPAAYTAVDKAESESELAYAINADAPRVLAEEAVKVGARLIHFSTDYVYAGTKQSPYTEEDETAPLSIYGKSKLAGEEAILTSGASHLIFRTSWVYGVYGNNFLKTILRLAKERDSLRIVADQVGAPTSSQSIADAILQVLVQITDKNVESKSGVYHLVNAGETSWHGFATAIVEEYSKLQAEQGWGMLKVTPASIQQITTAEYPTPAVRPANSRLDCSKLASDFSIRLPEWREALVMELQQLTA